MKKLKLLLFLILIFMLASCKETTTTNPYGINQDSFFGVGDVLVTDGVARSDIDKRINAMKRMGVKSHRFWIRAFRYQAISTSHSLFRIENNEIKVNDKYYEDTIYALTKLKEAGINHITLNISWLEGKENNEYVYYGGNCPSPEDPRYNDFLDVVYETYYKIGELYSDYEYVEMGNEYNGNFMAFNESTRWPLEVKTKFIVDFSYTASLALHDAAPNIKTVLNGVLDIEYVPTDVTGRTLIEEHSKYTLIRFFDYLYTLIESGEYPSNREEKSTNPDDYFEVIAYHPYTFNNLADWIKGNNDIYDVIVSHNDAGKSVFITEWGMEKINGYGGSLYKEIIENKDKVPFIEVVHYYIFSDAVDYSLYCLSKYNSETEDYEYTDSGIILYDAYGIK